MGDKVLLSTKYLNAMGDRKLVPHFVGPFSIIQCVEPVVYWMNLETRYNWLHAIFHISLFKPLCAGGDGYPHWTAVYIKDKQEWVVSGILIQKGSGTKGGVWLHTQETMNQKLVILLQEGFGLSTSTVLHGRGTGLLMWSHWSRWSWTRFVPKQAEQCGPSNWHPRPQGQSVLFSMQPFIQWTSSCHQNLLTLSSPLCIFNVLCT